MRRCPIKYCGVAIADRMFVCARHWKQFPQDVRDIVSEAFRRYISEQISLTELRDLTTEVLVVFQGCSPADVEDTPVAAAVGTCACGRPLVFAANPAGPYPLVEDPDGDTVVIGCVAQKAEGKAAIYTRFSRHWCAPHGSKNGKAKK